MNDEHLASLRRARHVLVEHRRGLAKILAQATDVRNFDTRAKFADLQSAIEAIDRAILDESQVKSD